MAFGSSSINSSRSSAASAAPSAFTLPTNRSRGRSTDSGYDLRGGRQCGEEVSTCPGPEGTHHPRPARSCIKPPPATLRPPHLYAPRAFLAKRSSFSAAAAPTRLPLVRWRRCTM